MGVDQRIQVPIADQECIVQNAVQTIHAHRRRFQSVGKRNHVFGADSQSHEENGQKR